jgi:hypothetical protein
MCWAIRGMLLGPSKKPPSCRATPDRASGHRPGAAQHRHEQAHPGDRRASGRGGCRRPRTSKAARCSPLTRRWRSSAGWYSSSGPSRKPLPRSGADESRAPSAAHSPNPRRRCHRIAPGRSFNGLQAHVPTRTAHPFALAVSMPGSARAGKVRQWHAADGGVRKSGTSEGGRANK